MTGPLRAPATGYQLIDDGAEILRDKSGRRWPVLDGIPFLRIGREDLAEAASDCIAAGDREAALVHLLADQDDWWTGPKPEATALRRLVQNQDRLSLRDAMEALAFGRVGDYFAHRWSDPTFIAGLGLLEAHWQPGTASAFELACGIGHYGRELMHRGVRYTGGDVVFAKLWLARHWVLGPGAELICFDAASAWPNADARYDLVFCHDAFYFLEPKRPILDTLRSLVAPGGRLALSHIHNSEADNLSSGRAISAAELAGYFGDGVTYDDAELTKAVVEGRAPQAGDPAALRHIEAFSVEDAGQHASPAHVLGGELTTPAPAASLRLNPLYRATGDGHAVVWPSERYQSEYASRATYPAVLQAGDRDRPDAVRRRILVDLPERW